MIGKWLVLGLLVAPLLISAMRAPAGQSDDNLAYDSNLAEILRLAEQGDSNAQINLGLMYSFGSGLPKDYVKAAKWFLKAAEQGEAAAQFNLGGMYLRGEGVPQDDPKAAYWYRLAAEQGVALAQGNLGAMYANGKGVPQSDQQAVKWTRRAAEQGEALSQYNLGVVYSNGRGVPQDYVEAHKWANLAASHFSPGDERDRAVHLRDFLEKKMTLSQIAEAQWLAREWRPKMEQPATAP